MAGQDSRVGERQPTSMRIKLKYPDVETFIQKYAVNISRGGIFIATKQPKPIGTYLKFEFVLSNAESQSIIRGEGQVQWTKDFDAQNPGKPHGMGVKFIRLDAESQQVVDRALKWRAEHGTSPGTQLPVAGSSAHATVTTRDNTGPQRLTDLADAEEATTNRRQSAELAAPVENTTVSPPPPPPATVTGRRDETRPIAISHDDEEPPARGLRGETRPISLDKRGRDEIDALASEWGLSEEKLARSLKRARPRIVEATAELERLLLKPPKLPTPSKAEALEKLAALLERRGGGAREANGSNGNGSNGNAAAEPENGDDARGEPGVSAGARPR